MMGGSAPAAEFSRVCCSRAKAGFDLNPNYWGKGRIGVPAGAQPRPRRPHRIETAVVAAMDAQPRPRRPHRVETADRHPPSSRDAHLVTHPPGPTPLSRPFPARPSHRHETARFARDLAV